MREEPVVLSAQGEAAWQALRRAAGWAEGFWWVGVFVDHVRVGDALRDRLSALHEVVEVRPEDLDGLRRAGAGLPAPVQAGKIVWLTVAHRAPTAAWREGWLRLAGRLNEAREALNRAGGGLVVVAPGAFKTATREAAPDLWSVHHLILDFGEPASAPPNADAPTEAPWSAIEPAPKPSTSVGLARFQEAEQALARGEADLARGRVIEALRHLDGRAPAAAGRAWSLLSEAALAVDDRPVALRAARQAVVRHREQVSAVGEGDSLALRDLSASLDRLGDVLRAEGDLSGAREAYAESLDLCRSLRGSLGDRPETLRDLSVSLDRLGDVLRAEGDLSGAREAYAESLALRRSLRGSLGDRPETLRDLSVSLDRLGDVLRAEGDLSGAREAYGESLDLCRSLRGSLGDRPETLRDLAVGLKRLAVVLRDLGDPDGARAHLREAIEVGEAMLSRWPHLESGYDLEGLKRHLADLHPPEE